MIRVGSSAGTATNSNSPTVTVGADHEQPFLPGVLVLDAGWRCAMRVRCRCRRSRACAPSRGCPRVKATLTSPLLSRLS